MSRHLPGSRAVPLCLVLCWLADIGSAQSNQSVRPDLTALAHRIAITSAGIKPGDVVVAGGKHTIPLMEAIAIEAQKAGGLTNLFLSSDTAEASLTKRSSGTQHVGANGLIAPRVTSWCGRNTRLMGGRRGAQQSLALRLRDR
jgi:hypothetical protein